MTLQPCAISLSNSTGKSSHMRGIRTIKPQLSAPQLSGFLDYPDLKGLVQKQIK